jgi:hypothetical protein
MWTLDDYMEHHPRAKGESRSRYERQRYLDWRAVCLVDARNALENGNTEEALREILQVLEEDKW